MNNDLGLPPYDRIPDEVRDRLRRSVQQRIHRRSHRAPLLVAAGVTVLVTASVVAMMAAPTTSVPASDGSPQLVAPTRIDLAVSRCADAIRQAGKADLFPDRSTWRPAVVTPDELGHDRTVLGIATSAEPFFCELTATTATVSDPNAARNFVAGSTTATLLQTNSGTIAGVLDPSWPAAAVKAGDKVVTRTAREGMFVAQSTEPLESAAQVVQRIDSSAEIPADRYVPLPRPEAPALSVVDQPDGPAEGMSAWEPQMRSCLYQTTDQVPDLYSYRPGAWLAGKAMMVRNSRTVDACMGRPSGTVVLTGGIRLADFDSAKVPMAVDLGYVEEHDTTTTIGGSVPVGTVRMEIRFGGDGIAVPTVGYGTWILAAPVIAPKAMTARLYGPVGGPTYDGPLAFWH